MTNVGSDRSRAIVTRIACHRFGSVSSFGGNRPRRSSIHQPTPYQMIGTNTPMLPTESRSLANDARCLDRMLAGSKIKIAGTSAGRLSAHAILKPRGGDRRCSGDPTGPSPPARERIRMVAPRRKPLMDTALENPTTPARSTATSVRSARDDATPCEPSCRRVGRHLEDVPPINLESVARITVPTRALTRYPFKAESPGWNQRPSIPRASQIRGTERPAITIAIASWNCFPECQDEPIAR